MIVRSLRLGQLEIPDNKIIKTEKPILGFEHLSRYCLIDVDELRPFLWMQSADDPAVAFLIVNPRVFFPDYKIEVNSKEIAELKVDRVESVETYVIVTLPEDPSEMSVNLQGPILINTENNKAKQLILVNSDYRIAHRILDTLPEESEETAAKELESVTV
ncbi:MAG: flagellar assembly protein FliW [Candidatus Zixiibacteriota bacterium]|nr:MAG: flagellar assembly protein FliW [candidate division Zixibacteria bacterium]